MLGFLFGFNARLGRLQYFLASLVLAVVMTAICFAIAGSAIAAARNGTMPTIAMTSGPVLGAAGLFAWASFTLQSMRFRDIGWDPVCVIPAWITVLIVDALVAMKFPALSLGHGQYGTAVGALTNVALMLALLFWPSGEYQSPSSSHGEASWKPVGRPSGSMLADRLARAAGGTSGGREF